MISEERFEDFDGIKDLVIRLKEPELDIRTRVRNDRIKEPGRSYLFGAGSHKLSREEYSRYVTFMNSITRKLNEFGIHINNNGYSYIIEAVMIIIDMKTLDIILRNDVYPYVALKHDYKRCSAIEHNIRNAIKSACLDYERNPGINNMGIFGKRPTNKQFLLYITECVYRDMCSEMISA